MKYLSPIYRAAAASLTLTLLLQPAKTQRGNSLAESFLARKERWAIKTGADTAAARIRLSTPQPAKVGNLIRLRRPVELPENASSRAARTNRYSDAEHTLFTIDADIVRYKLERDDHDFHVVIRDHDDTQAEDAPADSGRRRTMIVEFPDPAVVVPSSPWRSAIAAARGDFTSNFHPSNRFTYRVHHVRITGIGYFDYIHGQSGVAPNGIELHPVLRIEILEPGRTVAQRLHRTNRNNARAPFSENAGGEVWVNLNSGVFWRPGTTYYGKTKRGQYMSEHDAIKAGYHPAKAQ